MAVGASEMQSLGLQRVANYWEVSVECPTDAGSVESRISDVRLELDPERQLALFDEPPSAIAPA
jgi:hypothetical protein